MKKRDLSIDILRVIAIYMVIFNHSEGFKLFAEYPAGSAKFAIYMIISILCKLGVALFFMISGAVMLNRTNESMSSLWSKRIFRMIVVLLGISFVYFYRRSMVEGNPFSVVSFIKATYSSPQCGHLWYLYSYIGYLICLPFLRALVQNLEDRYFKYMIVLALVFNGCVNIFEHVAWKYEATLYRMTPWILTDVILWPALGYYLYHRVDVQNVTKKTMAFLSGLSIVAIIVSYGMTCYWSNYIGEYGDESQFQLFMIIPLITVFLGIRYRWANRTAGLKLAKLLKVLGECTFGVYLIHVYVMSRSEFLGIKHQVIDYGINDMLIELLYCFIVMAICYVIAFILHHIPFVKKLI